MSDGNQGSIVLFQGSPLEKIAASAVVPRNILFDLVHSRFFIGNDEIVMGDYGVAGFLIIDTRPEERWERNSDDNLFGVSHTLEHCVHLPEEARQNPFRLAHFINTHQGFKMIRYFLIPNNVKGLLSRDKYFGDPAIDKCCQEAGMPEYLDEEESYFVFSSHSSIDIYSEGEKLIRGVVEGIKPRWQGIGESNFGEYDFRRQSYLSFHAWQFYTQCLRIGQDSVVAAISNFDNLLSVIDKRGVLQKRGLSKEDAREYGLALPTSS